MVEDSYREVIVLIQCLKKLGYEVLNVGIVEVVKVMLREKNFDVILIDVVLLGQSGYSLCRELKK